MAFFKKLRGTVVQAFKGFLEDKCMKMSAALAYYTIFSIGPLLLIVIWFLGFFYRIRIENTPVETNVLSEIDHLFGKQVADSLQTVVENMSVTAESSLGLVIGIVVLIFSSTGIFIEMKDSLNMIWGVKAKPKKSWQGFIINRLISFSMILGLGFILIVSLLISSIISLLTGYIMEIIPGISTRIIGQLNNVINFLVILSLFGLIFKVLPDVKVQIKSIIGGALFTALLFILGRYGISLYLQHNATASAYGAAGSIILFLLWIYYSAAILYFGAEFTKEYAKLREGKIQPVSYAVKVEQKEIEQPKPSEDS